MLATAARLIAVVAVAVVVAAPASARSVGIGFGTVSKKVVQGENARIDVRVRPAGSRCTLLVRYAGGGTQSGLGTAVAAGGRASWTWRVPADVQAGAATATVRCARAGSAMRRVMIVGRKVEPKISVLKQGFSTRPFASSGTRLSYGVILHNDDPARAAVNVSVQVNFVMADNNLLGTDSKSITAIAPGADYALGNMVTFPGAAPITRLEVVVQVERHEKPTMHSPALANMHLVPQNFEPAWLGSVEGEVQNTDPTLILQSASLSAVVFDADGNVLGGGSGYAFQTLPPGAREFVKLAGGFDAIPVARAASTMVSLTPTWKQPGS